MARGAKPDLNNVIGLPLHKEPESAHKAISESLRPARLDDDERGVWDRLGPYLALLGRLKPHYADAFAEYCVITVRIRKARKYLDDEDWTYITTSRNGTQHKSRPEVAQLNDDWRKWRTLVGEFGLAPCAERGVKGDVQADLFDDFDNF